MNVAIVYRGRYLVRQALELETLVSVVRQAGHEVSFLYDPDIFGVTDNVFQVPLISRYLSSEKALARRISETFPDVVLFSSLPNAHGFLDRTAHLVDKNTKAPLVFLGLHPTLSPEKVLSSPWVDMVLAGEAEIALPILLNALENKKSLSQVPNLRFLENNRMKITPNAPLVDLSSLPLPDNDLFFPFVTHAHSYPAMVSRGCPFQCSYCEETLMKKLYGPGFFRRKSLDSVMAELVRAKNKYGFSEVIFKDSYLSGDEKWLSQLMERYAREIALPFKCFATITGFTENTARLLKQGGCYCVEFGLQTWNEGLRKEVLSRNETNAMARRVFSLCAERRLSYDVDHMFGLPGETRADHILGEREYANLDYLNRVKTHFLVYLPTAPLVEKAKALGTLSPDVDETLSRGVASDFFDQIFTLKQDKRGLAGFSALYKLLPILPRRVLNYFLIKDRARYLSHIPRPFMAFFQIIAAIRGQDKRFAIYLRDYPRRVFFSFVLAADRIIKWPVKNR